MSRLLGMFSFFVLFTLSAAECLQGTFSGNGQDAPEACMPCEAGKYADLPGSTECSPCIAGAYQPDSGQMLCLLCEPGTFSNVTGSISCTPCAEGKDSDEGAVECFAVAGTDNGGGGCTLAAMVMNRSGGSEPPRYDLLFLLATCALFALPFYSLYSRRAARIKL